MTEMQNRGLAVLGNGYPLIPIKPREKAPAISGWRTIEATEELVKRWGEDGSGIGIRTGFIVFIDIDILNAVADRVRSLCLRTLGPAPTRIGLAPKLGLMYRSETVFGTHISTAYEDRDGNRCAIEALADKRQFVAYGIHPITGEPYYWLEDRGPDTIPADTLTLVTEEQILQLLEQFKQIAAEEGWTRIGGGSATLGRIDGINPDADRAPVGLSDEEIMRAVGSVPNDDRFDPREDWLKFGFAIHHETGGNEFGREVWYEWSTQHPSHNEELFRRAWDSMGTRYGQPNDTAVTFRYILGILRDQRKAELAETVKRLTEGITKTLALDALTRFGFEISQLGDLDPAQRVTFVSQIQDAAKRLGARWPIGFVRELVSPRDSETLMPDWLKNWVFLKETDQFYNTRTTEYVGPNAFNRAFGRYVKDIPAARFATDLAKIPVHHMTAYLPGKEPVWVDPLEQSWVNTYRDTAPAIPEQYSERELAAVETVKAHARHLFGDNERDIAILHSALAYIVQTRKRINWMIVLQGAEAIGKTFYAHLLREVLGGLPHVYELTTETLTESSFSSWAEGHLVTYVEELKLHGKRYDVLNKMKSYITNEYVTVHAKYQAPRNVLNTASYFAFTNHRDALPLDDSDTRYFIMLSRWQNSAEVRRFNIDNPAYYSRLWKTLEDCPGALRRWLLEYDLHPDFDPDLRAPASVGKARVLRDAKSPLQQQIEDLLEEARPGITDDLVIAHLLREALADEYSVMPDVAAVRTVLTRLQFTPVDAGRIKITDPVTKERKDYYCWSRSQEIVGATTERLRQQIDLVLSQRMYPL